MSKLDDILSDYTDLGDMYDPLSMNLTMLDVVKQQIKDLMLELKTEAIKGSYSGSQALERFDELVEQL